MTGRIGSLQASPPGVAFHGTNLAGGGKLSGSMDEFRFWKVARSQKQIAENYFDNVGGPITDAVIPRLALRGRVVICGQISQYNLEEQTMAPSVLRHLLINQASMEGFIVTSFSAKFEEGRTRLAQWIRDGKLKYREDITDGIENAPKQFIELMRGHNFGKKLIRLQATA